MISFEEDDFIVDQYEKYARWVVDLSNGKRVFQDDERPGTTEPAWLRLKNYCSLENVYITSMNLQFRTHIVHVGHDVDGFYFSRAAVGHMVGNKTFNYYVAGTFNDGILRVKKWRIPELIVEKEEERDPNTKFARICLIKNESKNMYN